MQTHSVRQVGIAKWLLKPIGIGLITGALGCTVVLCLLAAFATIWNFPHAYVVPLGLVALAFGAWFGGWCGVRTVGRNGWLFGLVIALSLFLLSLLAGIGAFSSAGGSFFLVKMAIMLAGGMLGGMMAVNTGKRNSRRYHG